MAEEEDSEPPARADTEAFLAWLSKVPDPKRRYSLATAALEEHQETVNRLSALRAGALADAAEGASLAAVARVLGVSRQRAHQLVKESKGSKKPGRSSGAKQEAPRRQKGRKA